MSKIAVTLLFLVSQALAQSYPTKPIKVLRTSTIG